MIIILLSISLLITIVCLIVMYVKLKRVNELVRFLDEEQHTQNKDIIELLKYRNESSEMLMQHIEILKYLVEKDDLLGNGKRVIYPMVMGEA